MRKAILALAVVLVCTASAAKAASFPSTLTLNTATSNIQVSIQGVTPVLKVSFSSGTLDTTIEQTGSAPPAVSLTSNGGSIAVVDQTTNVKVFGLFSGTIGFSGVGVNIGSGGPFDNTTDSNPGTIDLGGLPIGLSSGLLKVNLPGIITTDLDLSADPLNFDLPPGSLANINEVPTGNPGEYAVTLSIPASIVTAIPISSDVALPTTVTVALNFTGLKVVPEPGSIALFGIGLVGLAVTAAKRYRRS